VTQFPPRTPTWSEIEQFCRNDGWEEDRTTDHVHFRKVLESGEVLETHRSLAGGKSMSQGRFGLILRKQLKVDRRTFWHVLQTGEPADRPTPVEEPPAPEYPGWVVSGLKGVGWTEERIRELTPDEAEERLHSEWSKARDEAR
jgi:hypothetical protein